MCAPEDLVRLAESFASSVSEQSGERLDLSPASLAIVDSLLDQWLHLAEVYAGAEPLDLTPYVMPTAAYAGEVLRRALGGGWIVAELPGAPPYLVVGGKLRLDVVQMVEQIYRRSRPPSLWDMYQAIERELSQQSQPANEVDT